MIILNQKNIELSVFIPVHQMKRNEEIHLLLGEKTVSYNLRSLLWYFLAKEREVVCLKKCIYIKI
jgi:hypothetical protein